MTNPIKVIIADDHPVFRSGLRQVIGSEETFTVIAEAKDGNEVVRLLEKELPDIVVLDIDMPGMNGLDVARHVQKNNIRVDLIVLTMYKEEYMFNKVMDLGVRGYILKENAVTDILAAIRSVAEGHYYISPSISEFLVRRGHHVTTPGKSHRGIADLTPSERRILKLIASKKTSKEIASELSISHKTVHRHRENIAAKLGLHGPNSLLAYAVENKSAL
ncbi:MAG: hypothetical protein A3H45_14605 [Ignavibacteria bacterium RIFCSPLOWO2_02_FULL_55_14]|nr:MAG: hypothetical protein A3H45_14605 [Ignavibacteria bacterium RIFCSPLOWO2_02_FULL_55_14]